MVLACLAMISVPTRADTRPELPRPTYENTFYMFMRCYGIPGNRRDGGEVDLDAQMAFSQDFLDRLGGQRLYSRLSLRGPGMTIQTKRALGFSDETGDAGFHRFFPNFPELKALTETDRRYLQWFGNGATETERRTHFGGHYACVSRYATGAWDEVKGRLRQQAERFLNQTPEIDATNSPLQVVVTGPGESSLLETGMRDGLLADYSPFAVAEFRDWLTNRGIYAEGADRAGEGRPGGEVFADDPSPAEAAGVNASFNETYGTEFATWELRYYDLERFAEPVPLGCSRPAGRRRARVH